MTDLGLVGIVDKGEYSASVTYNQGSFVYYNGSTWLALRDNLYGVTPQPGVSWKYLARGFAGTGLNDLQAVDTSGLIGSAGNEVNSQLLINEIADRVASKLLNKTDVANNLATTVSGYVLDARQGKVLQDQVTALKTDIIYQDVNLDGETFTVPAGECIIKTDLVLPAVAGYDIIAASVLNANGAANGNCIFQTRLNSGTVCIFNPRASAVTVTNLRFRYVLKRR